MTDDEIDQHLDAVLRASGSGFRLYTLPRVISQMREAMRAAADAAYQHGLSDGLERGAALQRLTDIDQEIMRTGGAARVCRRPDGCDDPWRCSFGKPETAPCGAADCADAIRALGGE